MYFILLLSYLKIINNSVEREEYEGEHFFRIWNALQIKVSIENQGIILLIVKVE